MLFHYNDKTHLNILTQSLQQNSTITKPHRSEKLFAKQYIYSIYTFIDHKTGDINSTEKQPKLPWKSYGTDLFMEYKLLCEKKQLNRKIFHTSRQHKFFLL